MTVWYGNDKGGRGGWVRNETESRNSMARMATLLQAPGSDQSERARAALGRYALGTRRSLGQYAAFSGIDPRDRANGQANCVVSYVPWADQATGQASRTELQE